LCGITTNPTGEWVTQQARNLATTLDEAGRVVGHLIRDRDAKFTRSFDDVWASIGARVVRTPVQTPNATPSRSAGSEPPAASVAITC